MKVNYCIECGKPTDRLNDTDYQCSNGHAYYNNPSPAVSVLPVKDGQFMLTIRGVAPNIGKLDTVGGFLDHSETAEEAVARETKEETGLDVKILDRLSSVNVLYENENNALGLFFIVEVIGGVEKAQDDAAELIWYPIDNPPKENLSWPQMTDAFGELQDWYKKHKS